MPASVVFPKVNLEKTSGEISSWAVSEGDEVSVGDLLFEVEDDKATVEIEAENSGFIGGLAEVDEEIDVGSVVALIFETQEDALSAASRAVTAEDEPKEEDAAEPVAPTPVAAQPTAVETKINPTPLARRLAKDNGLSLEGVTGTGPRGRIQKSDVLNALENAVSTAAIPEAAPAAAAAAAAPSPVVAAPTPSAPTPVVATPSSAQILNSVWFQKGEGLPIVMIHGFGADYTVWNGTLAGQRYDFPALAIDLPCHGDSGHHLPNDLDGIAADVEATLIAQGLSSVMIIAHSFGSAVAAKVASRGVIDVKALCLFAPAGLTPEANAGFIAGMTTARSVEGVKPWLQQLVDDASLITDPFVDRAMSVRNDDAKFGALQQFAMRFFPDGTQAFNVLDDLDRLLCPVRVVYGRQDRILPVSATRALPGNVALHLWNDCGHMPQFENRKDALHIIEEVRRSA